MFQARANCRRFSNPAIGHSFHPTHRHQDGPQTSPIVDFLVCYIARISRTTATPKWRSILLTRLCRSPPTQKVFRSDTANKTATLPPSDLLRRLNPKHTTDHLNSLISLAPDLTEDLLSSVDQPLTVKRCKQTGRDYLLCDYNRDGDSYRSPWSNQFDPPLDEPGPGGVGPGGSSQGAGEGAVPGERVRTMEVKANEAFDVYRELYYEGGVSSVYFWNLDDGFAGVVLLKKCESFHSGLRICVTALLADGRP